MMPGWDILSCGEVMMEFIDDGSQASNVGRGIGGDSFTVAAMGARLGSNTAYLTRLGRDNFLDFMRDGIARCRVDLSPARVCDGQSGVYFIHVDDDGERHFQYYRQGSAASSMQTDDIEQVALGGTRWVFSSGITQAITRKHCPTLVHTLFTAAKAVGARTAFDVNFRPNLWSLHDASSALSETLPAIDVLFASADERPVLQAVLGLRDASAVQLCEAALRQGIDTIVLKDGAKGVWVASADLEPTAVASPRQKPLDTTGAGDAFNGAFLAKLAQNASVLEAAQWATVAASLQVTRRGSASALPSADEVSALYARTFTNRASSHLPDG